MAEEHDLVPTWQDKSTRNHGRTRPRGPQHFTVICGRGSHARRPNAMTPTEQAPATEVTEEGPPQDEPDPTTVAELRPARDAFERELAISQRVKASTLETINLGSDENPRTLQIANNLPTGERASLVRLLTDYQDVVAPFGSGSLRESGENRRGFGLGER